MSPARLGEWIDRQTPRAFVLPAVVVILAFSIYPLLMSAYLAMSRFRLAPGGYELKFVALRNFKKLLAGSQQYHLLGTFGEMSVLGWSTMLALTGALAFGLYRYLRCGRVSVLGVVGRLMAAVGTLALVALVLATTATKGFPGSLVTTLFYVFVGVSIQFSIGLVLALLCGQATRGKSFFRVIFFIPLMVTPVGVAYAFRMLADVSKGPFAPLWQWLGLGDVAWAADAWSARWMVLIGDSWQWVPFMFIVLLAAIESQPREQVEAAELDGAGRWRVFADITWPAIAPVAATVVLIRLIEAFKIVDLPNILTNGGPGIATESLTLHSFIAWRTQDLGGSAAVGYVLLFVAVLCCLSFFNFVGRHAAAK